MPDMYYSNAATDADVCLADALSIPAPAIIFARFGSQTMDAIRQLANIFLQLVHQYQPPPQPQGALAQIYRNPLYRETLTLTHLRVCRP